jgi:hypothetical protein
MSPHSTKLNGLMSKQEVASFFGRTKRTIDLWERAGRIPSRVQSPSHEVMFDRGEIEASLRSAGPYDAAWRAKLAEGRAPETSDLIALALETEAKQPPQRKRPKPPRRFR